tara:strand:+ start:2768 stop:3259 length:492 start_codon:yes stop_codon:yes gene_type:complete
MSKIEYNSESQVWYLFSTLIIFLALICYFVVAIYALPDQSKIFPLLTLAINFSFFLLGAAGIFLAFQGYNFRNNEAILVAERGEDLALKIEALYLEKNVKIKEGDCLNLMDMGLWRSIKLFTLEKGEIEIKELWFSAFFYRTQIAFRGEVSKEIIEDYLINLV